jgi:hypothetical protein
MDGTCMPKYKQEIPNYSKEVLPFMKKKLISTILLKVRLHECSSIMKNHSFLLISSDGLSSIHTEGIMLGIILKCQRIFSFTNWDENGYGTSYHFHTTSSVPQITFRRCNNCTGLVGLMRNYRFATIRSEDL